MEVQHSFSPHVDNFRGGSVMKTPVMGTDRFYDSPVTMREDKHVRFHPSSDIRTSKSARSSATSVKKYLENSLHKSSFPRGSGFHSPARSYAVSLSRNSNKSVEVFQFSNATAKTPDRNETSSNKSESSTPRYKFHSSSYTPDSSLLLGTPRSNKGNVRNESFRFFAKSSYTADEVAEKEAGLSQSTEKSNGSENLRSTSTAFQTTNESLSNKEPSPRTSPTKLTTNVHKGEGMSVFSRQPVDISQKRPRSNPRSRHSSASGLCQRRSRDTPTVSPKSESGTFIRLSDVSSTKSPPQTSKKGDPVKLPPAKQNGHLVNSEESPPPTQQALPKEKVSDDKSERRQIADPKKKKKREEESPRQAQSAPSKRKDDENIVASSPKIDNYTLPPTSPTNDTGKKASTKETNERLKDDQRTNNQKKEQNNSSTFKVITKSQNGKTTVSRIESNGEAKSQTRNSVSRNNVSNARENASQPSRPVTKGRSEQVSNQTEQYSSPVPNSDTTVQSDDSAEKRRKEIELYKLRLPKKIRYGPVRAKRSRTPNNTPRSKTPRSRTPRSRTPRLRNYNYKRPGYSQSDTGDYRSTTKSNAKTSILNNKDAVRLEGLQNNRPVSYKWERDKSIYRNETKEWEDQRDELTWRPSVNSPTDWLRVYVGDINIRENMKSARSRKNSPIETEQFVRPGAPQKNSNQYILTRNQVPVYKNMHSVYGDRKAKEKQQRQKRFFNKLQECQTLKAKVQIEDMVNRQRKREITKQRQQQQLKELRQRFEDAAWVRFNTQYVTSRILEHEKMNRYAYGLPEDVDGEPEFASKLKRKNPKLKLDFSKLDKVNKKKYGSMFSIYTGPEWDPVSKTPPMEGIDTVEIDYETENGTKRVIMRRVKDVIKEAEQEMEESKAKSTNTGYTPRVEDTTKHSTGDLDLESDDDDDDMSDIFERARKKYNLEVDDDDVSRSRR